MFHIVTLNYRLGAFGFVAHPSIGANFGLQDQIAALRWVKDNISTFGGDPGNVTLFGESAGGTSVKFLLSSPQAIGLFHRAIIQSGGFKPAINRSWRHYDQVRNATERLFKELGGGNVDELRLVSWEKLKEASHKLCVETTPAGQVSTPYFLEWYAAVDGEIVRDPEFGHRPPEMPIMMGCTQNEGRYFARANAEYPADVLASMADYLCGPAAEKVMDILQTSEMTDYERLDHLMTESIFTTIHQLLDSGCNVYAYYFERCSPGALASGQLAEHTGEIPYIFGNRDIRRDRYYDSIDAQVSEGMQNAWVSFARDGKPTWAAEEGVTWPKLDAALLSTACLGDSSQIRSFSVSGITRDIQSERRRRTSPRST